MTDKAARDAATIGEIVEMALSDHKLCPDTQLARAFAG